MDLLISYIRAKEQMDCTLRDFGRANGHLKNLKKWESGDIRKEKDLQLCYFPKVSATKRFASVIHNISDEWNVYVIKNSTQLKVKILIREHG